MRTQHPCSARNTPADDGVLLSEFTTRFRTRATRRSSNVRRAAESLNGVVLKAGDRLSYNAVVGPRNRAQGYYRAPVIDQGKYVKRLGGGVCQPSSTLHAASLLGGMKILERVEHTFISAYIAPGLDATVVWRRKDLVIANPHPFPVRIAIDVGPGHMTVRLRGQSSRSGWTELRSKVLYTTQFGKVEKVDPRVAPGDRVLIMRGIRGMKLKRSRVWHAANGRTRIEALPLDIYSPQRQLWAIGPPEKPDTSSAFPVGTSVLPIANSTIAAN
jgi:vancomycin resistance protein YoaR